MSSKSSFYTNSAVTNTQSVAIEASVDNAAASATASENSANNASASASTATTKASEAFTSASTATTKASEASTSASTATTKASDAAASAVASEASKVASGNSSTASATSATSASNSATASATSATASSNSATASDASKVAAQTAKTNAETAETNAETAETNAASSASAASSSASNASSSAATATTKAGEASTSETNAAASQSSATASAATATTQANIATTKASEASTSATNAASSASSAQASKDAALAALDSFDDRYLGQKSGNPSVDNDGNALVAGALFFDTTSGVMKVYEGSSWVAAYASVSGSLIAASNLSDLASVSGARTNLGLGTAATTASTDYATAAQGTLADNALPKGGGAMTGAITTNSTFDGRDVATDGTKLDGIEAGATADQTSAEIRSLVESASDSNVFTDADHTKLNSIEASANVTDTANVVAALTAGTNVAIASDGTISSTDTNTTYSVGDGGLTQNNFTDADHTKLNGIEASANVTDTANVVAALTAGTNVAIAANGTISSTDTNTTYSVGDGGLTQKNFTSTLKTKLDGIETSAKDDQTITAGSGLSGGGTGNVTLSHSDTSSQASVNGSGRTYIQDITLDTYGHVTGLATATETVVNTDTNTTYSAGTGLDLSGTTFSIESDLRDNIQYIGRDGNDYMHIGTSVFDWYINGGHEMRLEADGDLHVDGNVVAYSTTISDERLKKDIVKIDNALDKVSQLNGYTFEYLADGKKSAGVIAQEVEKVMPSAIVESTLPLKMGEDDKTEYKTVQYDQLHGLMIEAIKELKAEIEELKAR